MLKKYVLFVDSSNTSVQLDDGSCSGTSADELASLLEGGNSHAVSYGGFPEQE